MRAYTTKAVKSPCYACRQWRGPKFPKCADVCAEMQDYRRYHGLPETRIEELPQDWAELGKNIRSPLEFTVEAVEMSAFLQAEVARTKLSFPALAAIIGLPYHRIAAIARGRYKRIRPDVAEKIEAYRQRRSHE